MDEQRVVITLSKGTANAEFTGMWTRYHIDTATRVMLRDLPKHIMALRAEGEKNASTKRSSQRRKRSEAA